MVGLAQKWVRLEPKLDKSGTFSNQISVHLARDPKLDKSARAPNALKSDLKKPRICPIWGPIWPTFEPNLPSLDQSQSDRYLPLTASHGAIDWRALLLMYAADNATVPWVSVWHRGRGSFNTNGVNKRQIRRSSAPIGRYIFDQMSFKNIARSQNVQTELKIFKSVRFVQFDII